MKTEEKKMKHLWSNDKTEQLTKNTETQKTEETIQEMVKFKRTTQVTKEII